MPANQLRDVSSPAEASIPGAAEATTLVTAVSMRLTLGPQSTSIYGRNETTRLKENDVPPKCGHMLSALLDAHLGWSGPSRMNNKQASYHGHHSRLHKARQILTETSKPFSFLFLVSEQVFFLERTRATRVNRARGHCRRLSTTALALLTHSSCRVER